MDLKELGKKVKTRREELGISQAELARRTGYTSRSTINKIEAGERDLARSKLVDLATALDTTPQYLLGWEPKNIRSELIELLESVPDEVLADVLNYTRYILSKQNQ